MDPPWHPWIFSKSFNSPRRPWDNPRFFLSPLILRDDPKAARWAPTNLTASGEFPLECNAVYMWARRTTYGSWRSHNVSCISMAPSLYGCICTQRRCIAHTQAHPISCTSDQLYIRSVAHPHTPKHICAVAASARPTHLLYLMVSGQPLWLFVCHLIFIQPAPFIIYHSRPLPCSITTRNFSKSNFSTTLLRHIPVSFMWSCMWSDLSSRLINRSHRQRRVCITWYRTITRWRTYT